MHTAKTTSLIADPAQQNAQKGPALPAQAAIIEIGDSGTATLPDPWDGYFIGTIASSSDVDLLRLNVTAGVTYTINFYGADADGGRGTLNDPYLRLLEDSSPFDVLVIDGALAVDADSGMGRDALFEFTATTSETILLELSSQDGSTGRYTLQIEDDLPSAPAVLGTLQDMATQLQSGNTNGSEYTFDTSSSNVITVNISGLTAVGQQHALWAMEAWEMVADLDFQTVTSGEMITVDDEERDAYAFFPDTTFIPDGVEMNVSSNINGFGDTLGSLTFQTYIQQFGQALGLGALGNYNSTFFGTSYFIDSGDAIFTNDSWQLSVMSAFAQNTNPTVDASYGFVTSAMMVDILAIQNLYGAPGASSATTGNTIYGEGSNLGNYLDDVFAAMVAGGATANVSDFPMAYTIYDRGGFDTLAFGFSEEDINLDMRGQQFSDFGDAIGMLGIADGTVIENAITGSGNDTVTGNAVANVITTNDGDDSISGGNNFDTISSGAGNDTVAGDNGRDLVFLNQGDDLYIDNAQGGELGRDTVFAGFGNDTIEGGNADDVFYGEWGNDVINARLGNDLVFGGDQFDTISAGEGQDTVFGGNGRDLIFLNQGDDLFSDNGQGGELGQDTVFGGFGNDTIQGGNGNDQFFGEWGNDLIFARLGDDTVGGGDGNDTINGGGGSDTLTGGVGVDTFIFDVGDTATGTDFVTDFVLGTDVFQLAGTMTATVDYITVQNDVRVFSGGNMVALLRSDADLSGFGVDDIVFV